MHIYLIFKFYLNQLKMETDIKDVKDDKQVKEYSSILPVVPTGWSKLFDNEDMKDIVNLIAKKLDNEKEYYPPKKDIFNAFYLCGFDNIKVVICGQDCYINSNQAMGLSFSVNKGCSIPPSLQNIFKVLKKTVKDFEIPSHGDLTGWCKQGVFLYNAALTVRPGLSESHLNNNVKNGVQNIDIWGSFRTEVIKFLANKKQIVYICLGSYSQKLMKNIDKKKNCILNASHPSPFSAHKSTKDTIAFMECDCFNEANKYLVSVGKDVIDWNKL